MQQLLQNHCKMFVYRNKSVIVTPFRFTDSVRKSHYHCSRKDIFKIEPRLRPGRKRTQERRKTFFRRQSGGEASHTTDAVWAWPRRTDADANRRWLLSGSDRGALKRRKTSRGSSFGCQEQTRNHHAETAGEWVGTCDFEIVGVVDMVGRVPLHSCNQLAFSGN